MTTNKTDFGILFVFPNVNSGFAWNPAIQILSAVLKKDGFPTYSIHIHEEYGVPYRPADIVRRIEAVAPKVIAMTATSFEFTLVNELAGEIKKHGTDAFLILGGMQATLQPEAFADSQFDGFCIGEGEEPLLQLVQALHGNRDFTKIKSLWVRKGGAIIKNPIETFVQDLDSLPFIDWDIFDTEKILRIRNGWLSISFSRGCPHSCSFCVNHALRTIKGSKKYCRRRSPVNAVAEIRVLAKSFDIKVFNFDDDLLVLNKKWFSQFAKLYETEIYAHYQIQYKIEARADNLDQETIMLLKTSGCREVQIGVETGDEYLRNSILKKKLSDERIKDAIVRLKASGIQTLIFIMIGVPGETVQSLTKTVDFIADSRPYLVRPTFFVPIPHTPLYTYCATRGLFRKDRVIRNHFLESALQLRAITDEALLAHKYLLPWHVNEKLGLSRYVEAINQFAGLSYDQILDQLENVLAMDQSLSSEHVGYVHYSYFKDNMNYLVLNNAAL